MASVDLFLNGRLYQIACDDGQEAHVKALAERYDARLKNLSEKLGASAPENFVLVLAALMAEDELHTVKKLGSFAANTASSYPAKTNTKTGDTQAAQTINDIAERIERLAARLENA